jgi:hypothetical protein
MPHRSLELGITAIQAGSIVEGARLIRIALKNNKLADDLRAIGYLWLAEIENDPQRKRALYGEALRVDPNNEEARARLARLMSAQLPPMSAQTSPPQPSTSYATPLQAAPQHPSVPASGFNVADHVANIIGGPNGPGTGLLVSPDGILVTTRFIVGSSERLTVELHMGRQLTGYVIRAYPELDLAFIHIDHRLDAVLPITAQPRVPDEATLIAVTYSGEMLRGKQRPTKRAMANHWISTSFTRLADTGGDPIFDERNYLIGMMTRNTGRQSGYLYGIHIAAIRRCLELFLLEQQTENRTYCPSCGSSSRAGGAGYFYCEVCGSTMPQANHLARYPIPQAELYYGASSAQCTRCGARVGLYKGRCLRCGQPPQTGTLTPQ